jgi:hypothetical protein
MKLQLSIRAAPYGLFRVAIAADRVIYVRPNLGTEETINHGEWSVHFSGSQDELLVSICPLHGETAAQVRLAG